MQLQGGMWGAGRYIDQTKRFIHQHNATQNDMSDSDMQPLSGLRGHTSAPRIPEKCFGTWSKA